MANENPTIVRLMYDLDLMPEQLSAQKEMTIGLFAAYNRLEGILLAFKAMELDDDIQLRSQIMLMLDKVGVPTTEPDSDKHSRFLTTRLRIEKLITMYFAKNARIAELQDKLEDARYLGDNHHNAKDCPYCNMG
jgi:hypothetical protein